VRTVLTFIGVVVALLLLASLAGGVGAIELGVIVLIALVAAVVVATRRQRLT
jgi:hypothetical protein